MRIALALVVLAACSDPPPLTIKYALKTEGPQVCYANLASQAVASSCTDVSMVCRSVLDLRIVSANDPNQAYVKLCQEVIGRQNLCSIAGIDLPKPVSTIPEQTLAVEVALYRWDDLAKDDLLNPICPTDLAFADDGTPQTSDPTPVVGGRAFYHPGDTQTVVDLSCFDEPALQDPHCLGKNTISVTATVNDFDAGVAVTSMLADNLSVSIAEPTLQGSQYTITQTQLMNGALPRTPATAIPSWAGNVELQLMSTACLDVDEGVAESTHTVTCKQVAAKQSQVDLPGVRLSKSSLDQILGALGATTFPEEGLVVGIVLDQLGNPYPDVNVTANDGTPTPPTVSYLAMNRSGLITGATSNNGIFLSTDAPYGTTFTAHGPSMNQPVGFGGLVAGKVNIVVLQFTQPTNP